VRCATCEAAGPTDADGRQDKFLAAIPAAGVEDAGGLRADDVAGDKRVRAVLEYSAEGAISRCPERIVDLIGGRFLTEDSGQVGQRAVLDRHAHRDAV
jgi:hypothetical protein